MQISKLQLALRIELQTQTSSRFNQITLLNRWTTVTKEDKVLFLNLHSMNHLGRKLQPELHLSHQLPCHLSGYEKRQDFGVVETHQTDQWQQSYSGKESKTMPPLQSQEAAAFIMQLSIALWLRDRNDLVSFWICLDGPVHISTEEILAPDRPNGRWFESQLETDLSPSKGGPPIMTDWTWKSRLRGGLPP